MLFSHTSRSCMSFSRVIKQMYSICGACLHVGTRSDSGHAATESVNGVLTVTAYLNVSWPDTKRDMVTLGQEVGLGAVQYDDNLHFY